MKVLVSRNHAPVIKRTTRNKSFNPISTENCIIYNDQIDRLLRDKAVAD